nr:hypothetical protein [Tanacetum cinerariifolium]
MAPLPSRDQRHLWLRYSVEGYTEEILDDFEQRLETIFDRQPPRPERKQAIAAGAHEGDKAGPAVDEVVQHIPAPIQAPQPPPPAPQPWTMSYRIDRIEEVTHELRQSIDLVETMIWKVKYYEAKNDCFIDFETEFPAIVFDNTLTSDTTSFESTVARYTEEIVHDFKQRLKMIFGKQVNRVHILDFDGLTPKMRQDLAVKLRMMFTRDDGQLVFVRHAWRRLFGIQAPLVCGFILEFLSTCRMSDTEMGLNVVDTLCFQLGGVEEDDMEAVYSSVRYSGKGQAPEKATAIDLFYLRNIDRGTTNVPHLLAQYLFRHVEGRKSETSPKLERQQAAMTGTHEGDEVGLVVDEGAQDIWKRIYYKNETKSSQNWTKPSTKQKAWKSQQSEVNKKSNLTKSKPTKSKSQEKQKKRD